MLECKHWTEEFISAIFKADKQQEKYTIFRPYKNEPQMRLIMRMKQIPLSLTKACVSTKELNTL